PDRALELTVCCPWRYGPVPAEDPARPFEVPQILNVHHGVFIVENLDTRELARDGVREFALILTHPKLRGASGAWASPIALVEDRGALRRDSHRHRRWRRHARPPPRADGQEDPAAGARRLPPA